MEIKKNTVKDNQTIEELFEISRINSSRPDRKDFIFIDYFDKIKDYQSIGRGLRKSMADNPIQIITFDRDEDDDLEKIASQREELNCLVNNDR